LTFYGLLGSLARASDVEGFAPVYDPINGSSGGRFTHKYLVPLAIGKVRRDHKTLSFISFGNELEKEIGSFFALGGISQFIKHH
jgi:hypothetical protein